MQPIVARVKYVPIRLRYTRLDDMTRFLPGNVESLNPFSYGVGNVQTPFLRLLSLVLLLLQLRLYRLPKPEYQVIGVPSDRFYLVLVYRTLCLGFENGHVYFYVLVYITGTYVRSGVPGSILTCTLDQMYDSSLSVL